MTNAARFDLAVRLADVLARRRLLADASVAAMKRGERDESDRLWYASQALFRNAEHLDAEYARLYGDDVVRGGVEEGAVSAAPSVADAGPQPASSTLVVSCDGR